MAAQNMTMTVMTNSGIKTIDVYLPDAAGTLATFNPSGPAGTTSPTTLIMPGAGRIIDLSVAASPTATSGVFVKNSGTVNGGVIRWANQLNTLSSRQPLSIPFSKGDQIGINLTT